MISTIAFLARSRRISAVSVFHQECRKLQLFVGPDPPPQAPILLRDREGCSWNGKTPHFNGPVVFPSPIRETGATWEESLLYAVQSCEWPAGHPAMPWDVSEKHCGGRGLALFFGLFFLPLPSAAFPSVPSLKVPPGASVRQSRQERLGLHPAWAAESLVSRV